MFVCATERSRTERIDSLTAAEGKEQRADLRHPFRLAGQL